MEILGFVNDMKKKFERGVNELQHHPETIIKLSPTAQLVQGLKNVEKGLKRTFKMPEIKIPEFKMSKIPEMKLPKVDLPKLKLPELPQFPFEAIKEKIIKYGIPIIGGIIGLVIIIKIIPLIFARKTVSKYIE